MDDVLSAIASTLNRLIGRNADCGFDCDVSQFSWVENPLLLVIFILAFIDDKRATDFLKTIKVNITKAMLYIKLFVCVFWQQCVDWRIKL